MASQYTRKNFFKGEGELQSQSRKKWRLQLMNKDPKQAKKNLVTIYEPQTHNGWYGTCQHLFATNPAKDKDFQAKKIL